MSISAMKLVWEHSQHSETDLVIMLALADIANDEGYAWPSIPTLATRARRKERSLIDTLERLEQSKEVFIHHNVGRNKSNQYIITLGIDKDELANRLVKYLDYSPTQAVEKATAFFSNGAADCTIREDKKGAVGSKKVQPTAPNESGKGAVGCKEKVQSAARKGAADCTRSIIEPSIEPRESESAANSQKPPPPETVPKTGPHCDPRKFRQGRIPGGKGSTAVEVYYERHSIRDNETRLSDPLEDDIMAAVKDLSKWRRVVSAWQQSGYRPKNIKGQLEWYVNGIPANKSTHQNGGDPGIWHKLTAEPEQPDYMKELSNGD